MPESKFLLEIYINYTGENIIENSTDATTIYIKRQLLINLIIGISSERIHQLQFLWCIYSRTVGGGVTPVKSARNSMETTIKEMPDRDGVRTINTCKTESSLKL